MWLNILIAVAFLVKPIASQSGNHPEWPRWCGKAYMPEYPSFDPGGWTREPAQLPDGPGLYMQFAPRYNIYLESEDEGEFVVSAHISEWHGEPWPSLESPTDAPPVYFTINLVSSNDVLISNNITVGTADKVLNFTFGELEPSFDPYEVVLFGATEDGEPTVSATSELFYLPEKETGSVARLDNLNGGIRFRNPATNGIFEPVMPYGFYSSCDNFLCEDDAISAVQAYYDLGLNGMIPLTTIWDSRPVFEFMDELDLKYMYDLRSYYKNLTETALQVSAIKDFDSLFGYWGSDEPDGWQDPFNGTVAAFELIRSIDPYHPVAVTLNCQNYYFDEYTRGADIIMEDTYPIGVNGTYSKWGTPCNLTYGDCGCDNCQGNVQDVPSRLDDLAQYEDWLGFWPKTKAHNPQSFHGQDYWLRDPTVDEAVVMNALAFNHDAKYIISWVWPTADDLAKIHGEYASVVTRSPVKEFIVGEKAHKVEVADREIVDVAYWKSGSEILLCVVNGGYVAINETIKITLPDSISPAAVQTNVWGDMSWQLVDDGVELAHLGEMSTYMAIFELA